MKKIYLIPVVWGIFFLSSCSNSETKEKAIPSLMNLGSEAENVVDKSESILDRFDGWDHRIYYGIDISHYQGDLLKLMTSTDSLHFVITKATEGTGYVDPDFRGNWREIKEKGLIRGAYHFYLFKDDPISQAEHFAEQINDIEYSDIPPIVDVEAGGLDRTVTKQNMKTDLLKFIKKVDLLVKRKPIIYTNTAFADEYLNDEVFSDYELWLAEYTKGKPRIPEVWKEKGYLIWQKSENYNTYSTATDFDLFEGRLNEFLR